eukprot:Lankesteria_metandrocarpae@DN5489_c3_g3_i1.p1
MDDGFAVLPVVRYDAGPALTFRLKLMTHGPPAGARRVNILQVKDGVHYHSFDSSKVVIASIVSNPAGGGHVINWHSGVTFPQNKLPVVLGQVISASAEYKFYRVYDRTTTGFTALVPLGAQFGYIAVHAGGRSSGLFGPNMLAVTTYEDSTAAFASEDPIFMSLDGVGFSGTAMHFVEINTIVGTNASVVRVISEDESQFTYNVREDESLDNNHQNEGVATLSFGFEYNRNDRASEDVSLQNMSCPYLHSFNDACPGLFKYNDVYDYVSVDGLYTMSQESNEVHTCNNRAGGGQLASGNFAVCALYDKFCSQLSVLSGDCEGVYTQTDVASWTNAAGNVTLDHDSTLLESYTMNLECSIQGLGDFNTGNGHRYVCKNEYIPSGVRYGMNKINGENVYVVGNSRIHVNGMHRMFEVQTPADGSSVYVYPLVAPWGNDSSVVKVTPKSDPAAPAVAFIDLVRDGAFRVQMVSGSCDATPGATSMSVMQIRRGHFHDPWNGTENIFAAYRNITGLATVPYGDHQFPSRPLVFVQLQKVTAGPALGDPVPG